MTQSAFTAVVRPILSDRCVSCHGPEKSKALLRLDSFEALKKGSENGPVVVGGNAGESELVKRLLLPVEHDDHMPPDGKPQPTPDELTLIQWWIEAGASSTRTVAELKPPPKVMAVISRHLGAGAQPAATPQAASVPAMPRDQVVGLAETLAGELKVPITALSESESWLQCNASVAGKDFKDEQLAKLSPIASNVRWLDLGGTAVTDAGLAYVSGMQNLTRLHLERTAISDAGLAAMESLTNLEYLNLYATSVTDEGLGHLQSLPKLRQLYLWQTQVSQTTAVAFAEARIDREQLNQWQGQIEQLQKQIRDAHVDVVLGTPLVSAPATNTATAPINTECPVSGKPASAEHTSLYKGKLVAFCCDDCKAKFEKDPTPFIAKLAPLLGEAAAFQKPVNTDCPVSGKPADPNHTVVHEGKVIAFCCDDCKAQFTKDPKAYLAKLKLNEPPQ